MDLVSAAAWGSAHSDNKPPPRLPSLPGSLPSDGRSATATGFPAMAQRASPTFLLYSSANRPLPPVSFMAPTAGPAQRPGCPQSTTGLDFVVHFGGPSLQACIAIKYPLFLRVIIYSSHPQNTPSRMSPDSLSTNNCWAPAVYSSIGNTVAPNIRLFQGQYVYMLCSLSCSLWLFEQEKKNWKLPNCWTIREWLNKIWCFHLIESCLAIKSKVYEESKISECSC